MTKTNKQTNQKNKTKQNKNKNRTKQKKKKTRTMNAFKIGTDNVQKSVQSVQKALKMFTIVWYVKCSVFKNGTSNAQNGELRKV